MRYRIFFFLVWFRGSKCLVFKREVGLLSVVLVIRFREVFARIVKLERVFFLKCL